MWNEIQYVLCTWKFRAHALGINLWFGRSVEIDYFFANMNILFDKLRNWLYEVSVYTICKHKRNSIHIHFLQPYLHNSSNVYINDWFHYQFDHNKSIFAQLNPKWFNTSACIKMRKKSLLTNLWCIKGHQILYFY